MEQLLERWTWIKESALEQKKKQPKISFQYLKLYSINFIHVIKVLKFQKLVFTWNVTKTKLIKNHKIMLKNEWRLDNLRQTRLISASNWLKITKKWRKICENLPKTWNKFFKVTQNWSQITVKCWKTSGNWQKTWKKTLKTAQFG